MPNPKLIRITTVPMSLQYLLRGQLAYMKANGFDVLAVSADGKERQYVLRDGIDHIIIPFTRKITPIRDLICLLKLIRLFQIHKPTIVHTHTPKAGLLGMLAGWICNVPVRLHTVAGLPLMEATGFKRWVLLRTERITYACAHKVYANSVGLLKYIREQLTIDYSQLSIVGKGSSNGIDIEFFSKTTEINEAASQIRKDYGIPETSIVFSFVGRVVKDKGIGELIVAFKKLFSLKADVYLLIVGPLEQDLDPLSNDDLSFLQSNSRIIMAGFQQDVRPWLLASNVFVFPSYREGFPNVVMQAACLELPCIVSDINGCNEIILRDKTGLIIPPKNAQSLFDAMRQLSNDEILRRTFGSRARAFVSENFDQQFIWSELLKEYRSLIQA